MVGRESKERFGGEEEKEENNTPEPNSKERFGSDEEEEENKIDLSRVNMFLKWKIDYKKQYVPVGHKPAEDPEKEEVDYRYYSMEEFLNISLKELLNRGNSENTKEFSGVKEKVLKVKKGSVIGTKTITSEPTLSLFPNKFGKVYEKSKAYLDAALMSIDKLLKDVTNVGVKKTDRVSKNNRLDLFEIVSYEGSHSDFANQHLDPLYIGMVNTIIIDILTNINKGVHDLATKTRAMYQKDGKTDAVAYYKDIKNKLVTELGELVMYQFSELLTVTTIYIPVLYKEGVDPKYGDSTLVSKEEFYARHNLTEDEIRILDEIFDINPMDGELCFKCFIPNEVIRTLLIQAWSHIYFYLLGSVTELADPLGTKFEIENMLTTASIDNLIRMRADTQWLQTGNMKEVEKDLKRHYEGIVNFFRNDVFELHEDDTLDIIEYDESDDEHPIGIRLPFANLVNEVESFLKTHGTWIDDTLFKISNLIAKTEGTKKDDKSTFLLNDQVDLIIGVDIREQFLAHYYAVLAPIRSRKSTDYFALRLQVAKNIKNEVHPLKSVFTGEEPEEDKADKAKGKK